MTAATADRKAPQYGSPDEVDPSLLSLPVAASTIIYAGTFVASDAAGNAVPASSNSALKLWGRCEVQVDNSAGTAGAKRVQVRQGVFAFNNSGAGADQIAAANIGLPCYAVDDNVVALTDGNGARPFAGVIFPFDPNNTTQIQVGVGPSFAPIGVSGAASGSALKARGVVFANVASLAAFTVAANDGITYVAGDVVLLTAQTTAAQNGPYVVGTVGGGTAPLTRPSWWSTGALIEQGVVIDVGGEGTIFGGSSWKALCAKAKIVDTDDPVFYPRVCKGTVSLASGTKTLGATQGLFLKSTTASTVHVTRNTLSGSTVSVEYYAPVASRVAGVSGTAAVVINAAVAAGTLDSTDTSSVDFLVTNW